MVAQDPLSGFKAAISEERFTGYRRTAASAVEAVGRYTWNPRLSEALYPALLNFEVALRNALYKSLAHRYSTGPWLDVPCWMDLRDPILGPDEVKEVNKAKRRLVSRAKPLVVGSLVAELNFGFWNSLLESHSSAAQPRLSS